MGNWEVELSCSGTEESLDLAERKEAGFVYAVEPPTALTWVYLETALNHH